MIANATPVMKQSSIESFIKAGAICSKSAANSPPKVVAPVPTNGRCISDSAGLEAFVLVIDRNRQRRPHRCPFGAAAPPAV
jgi:hypothetical protein